MFCVPSAWHKLGLIAYYAGVSLLFFYLFSRDQLTDNNKGYEKKQNKTRELGDVLTVVM